MNRIQRCTTPLALLALVAACVPAENQAAADDQEVAIAADLRCQPTASGADLAERASPYDSTMIRLGDGAAKICYSRPYLRGRTMIGGSAVPYDTLWRTGANEPTIIHLSEDAEVAGIPVSAGSYSLYTIPREEGPWTLIINRSTSQWGHESRYTDEVRDQEVGRAEVAAERLEQTVEQFTIRPTEGDETGVVLEWQNSSVRIPIRPAG